MSDPVVLYEDRAVIALNKPAGLLVHHAAHTAGEPTLADWLLARYPELATVGDDPSVRPGIVHRLDRETSGVMIVARTQEMFLYLKERFASRDMEKTYRALVHGVIERDSGTVDAPIGIRNGSVKRSIFRTRMQKEAVTDYTVLERFADATLVAVHPHTGRTHQIRVHLASIGHAVIGDRLYAPRSRRHAAKVSHDGEAPSRLMLHALSIGVPFPDGRRMHFEAAPGLDFEEVLLRYRSLSTSI